MFNSRLPMLFLSLLLAGPVWAAPKVVTDIAPVHSLVAQVMGDIGTPTLLVKPGMSPHNYALRPSQARALQQADFVFWIGPALTPWLKKPLTTLAVTARRIPLQDAEGITYFSFREAMETGAEHHDADDNHDHGPLDPHIWLDPQNGQIWLDLIAAELAQIDPRNALKYRANAAEGKAVITTLIPQLQTQLTPLKDSKFLVFHDSYQYFETRFGLAATGAISVGDGATPSAARIRDARQLLVDHNISCVFSEPQFNANVVKTVTEGSAVGSAILDPLGQNLALGKDLYPQLFRAMAKAFTVCN